MDIKKGLIVEFNLKGQKMEGIIFNRDNLYHKNICLIIPFDEDASEYNVFINGKNLDCKKILTIDINQIKNINGTVASESMCKIASMIRKQFNFKFK